MFCSRAIYPLRSYFAASCDKAISMGLGPQAYKQSRGDSRIALAESEARKFLNTLTMFPFLPDERHP